VNQRCYLLLFVLHQVSPGSGVPPYIRCPKAVESLLTSVSPVESLLHHVSPGSGDPPYISVPIGVPLTSVSPVESILHQVSPGSGFPPYISVPSGVALTSGVPRQWSPSYISCPQAVESLLHSYIRCLQAVESLLTSVSQVESLLHQVSPGSGFPLRSVSPVESLLHQVSPVESLFTSGVPR
ncbi:hypothetical protein AB205_0215580, partial [Aquarana catesbeiana]